MDTSYSPRPACGPALASSSCPSSPEAIRSAPCLGAERGRAPAGCGSGLKATPAWHLWARGASASGGDGSRPSVRAEVLSSQDEAGPSRPLPSLQNFRSQPQICTPLAAGRSTVPCPPSPACGGAGRHLCCFPTPPLGGEARPRPLGAGHGEHRPRGGCQGHPGRPSGLPRGRRSRALSPALPPAMPGGPSLCAGFLNVLFFKYENICSLPRSRGRRSLGGRRSVREAQVAAAASPGPGQVPRGDAGRLRKSCGRPPPASCLPVSPGAHRSREGRGAAQKPEAPVDHEAEAGEPPGPGFTARCGTPWPRSPAWTTRP